jgi:lipopolysaccharide transport system ATP-binding protein
MSETMLRIDGVSKRFRKGELFDSLRDALPALVWRFAGRSSRGGKGPQEFWALRDVSFSVGRGEVLGIIGHNGAGKSTILKLLSGVLRPTAGTIKVNGSLAALIEVGAGFHPDLTGRENIYLNGAIFGLSRAEITRKFDQIVEFSGLAEFLDTPVKRYSTGMYARLGFAVAAHVDSDILLVDEVLSVGDYLFQNKCMERMKEIRDRGTAIVFVSHNLDAVATFCSRVILLDHGRIVKEGDPQAIVATYTELERAATCDAHAKDAFVSGLIMRDQNGPRTRFQAGDDVWLDIAVTANRPCERLSLAVYLKNDRNIESFYTSSVRLGLPPLTLDTGATKTFTFRLKLHLAGGTFHLGAQLYRYDFKITKIGMHEAALWHIYDDVFPLGRLFVNSPTDVGGVANLYPEIEVSNTEVSGDRSGRLLEPVF